MNLRKNLWRDIIKTQKNSLCFFLLYVLMKKIYVMKKRNIKNNISINYLVVTVVIILFICFYKFTSIPSYSELRFLEEQRAVYVDVVSSAENLINTYPTDSLYEPYSKEFGVLYCGVGCMFASDEFDDWMTQIYDLNETRKKIFADSSGNRNYEKRMIQKNLRHAFAQLQRAARNE